jgi:anti-sigma factor RsiW
MRCPVVRRRLSAFLDGDLAPADARCVGAHIEACPACGERARQLKTVSEALGEMTRLEAPASIALGVRDRLEMERRDPGLAHLFRSSWRARPLMLPSLIPAALVLVTVLSAALALDHDPFPMSLERAAGASWERRYPPSGTEANPLLPVAGVRAPRARPSGGLPPEALAEMEEGTLFLETVVARDGSVSAVNLLQGNSHQAGPVLEALRRERFWPGQFNGRPVAVSVYRLISRMDVRPPVT